MRPKLLPLDDYLSPQVGPDIQPMPVQGFVPMDVPQMQQQDNPFSQLASLGMQRLMKSMAKKPIGRINAEMPWASSPTNLSHIKLGF